MDGPPRLGAGTCDRDALRTQALVLHARRRPACWRSGQSYVRRGRFGALQRRMARRPVGCPAPRRGRRLRLLGQRTERGRGCQCRGRSGAVRDWVDVAGGQAQLDPVPAAVEGSRSHTTARAATRVPVRRASVPASR
jgi:hypothetical protein